MASFERGDWPIIRAAAIAQRFDWHSVAQVYRDQLYNNL